MANQRFKNDLKNNDPDFDLDSYIEEQSHPASENLFEEAEIEKQPSTKRNIIALALFVLLPAFWFFNSDPFSVFGDDTNTITGSGQNMITPPPPPPIPSVDIPQFNTSGEAISSSYLDYLREATDKGYTNYFSNTGIQALYNSGVPLSYLGEIEEGGFLDDFSYSAVIGLYSGGVPVAYLTQFQDAGILDTFSYSAIIGFLQWRSYHKLYQPIPGIWIFGSVLLLGHHWVL